MRYVSIACFAIAALCALDMLSLAFIGMTLFYEPYAPVRLVIGGGCAVAGLILKESA